MNIFSLQNAFENAACEMAAVLFRYQRVELISPQGEGRDLSTTRSQWPYHLTALHRPARSETIVVYF